MNAPHLHVVTDPNADTTAGKLPPHDLEAEGAVLSAVILDELALPKLVDFLAPEHFYSEAHRRIFEVCVDLRNLGKAIDAQTVASRLRETGRLAQVGGAGYIAEVLDGSPAVANVRHHAVTVFERWRARQVVRICRSAVAEGYGGTPDVQTFAESAARALGEIARQQPGVKVESNIGTLKRLVREMQSAASRASGSQASGVPTGVRAYDEATLGLHPGQKTTLVALPRVGKTAYALQVAMHVARQGFGVIFFSTEMTREELGQRQLSHLSGVDGKRIKQAMQKTTLSSVEWQRLVQGIASLQGMKYTLSIHDDTSITAEEIASRSRLQAEQSMSADGVPLGLIVVDYVQRLKASKHFEARRSVNKYEQVSHATGVLKTLARDLGVPVLELAQQKNGEVDSKSGKRSKPSLGMAAESMQIERDADNVLYLYRPNDRDGRNVKAYLAKQRSGEEVEFDLEFQAECSRFVEPAEPSYGGAAPAPGVYQGSGAWYGGDQ